MTILGSEDGYLEVEPHDPADRRSDREVIVLLHGLGGTKSDWAFPSWRPQTYDHRIEPPPRFNKNNFIPPPLPYPLNPLKRFGLSPKRNNARCWRGILRSKGHTIVNFSQDGNQERVETPLKQFQDRIAPFIRDEVLVDQLAGKKVIFLCHSRGGILARTYLRDNPNAGDWIKQIITICSPHRGTESPGTKQRLADEAAILAIAAGMPSLAVVVASVLVRLLKLLEESPGARQLFPDDPLFTTLPEPADLPQIAFDTFGGTSPAFSAIYGYLYTLDSFVPNFSDFPDVRFDWTAEPLEIGPISPLFNAIPDIAVDDEQKDGRGDGLVTDLSASMPGTTHRSMPVNHIEALYDEALFAEVLQLLGTPMDGSEVFQCSEPFLGNRHTLQLHDPANEHTNCQLDEIRELSTFDRVEDGLDAGYDGCYYCLPQFHHPD